MRWRGRVVRSAIWKTPLAGHVSVGKFGLQGDRQADPAFHGGAEKSIYVYPSEHYAYWRARLGELAWGAFGENFTTEGILEHEVHVGDELRIGSVLLEVTQPRRPCVKLAVRFERPRMVREFELSGRSGFYCTVRQAGAVAAGDPITWGERARTMPTISELLER